MSRRLLLVWVLLFSTAFAVPRSAPEAGRSTLRRLSRGHPAVYNPLIASRQVKASDIRSQTPTKRQNCANPGPSGCPCTAGQMNCGSGCIDVTSDPFNCGSCGYVCPVDGQRCNTGACECPNYEVVCTPSDNTGSYCALTSTDPSNCGSCGNICPVDGQLCNTGTCECPNYEVVCTPSDNTGSYCALTSTDPSNCGTCGNVCADGDTCLEGLCCTPVGLGVCSTPDGSVSCIEDGASLCTPSDGSALYCAVTSSDPSNCGSCETVCTQDTGSYCATGACSFCDITSDFPTFCDGSCTNLQYDPNNCGYCGNLCPSDYICSEGTCEPTETFGCNTMSISCGGGSWCNYVTDECLPCPGPADVPVGLCQCGSGTRTNNIPTNTCCDPGLILCYGACYDPTSSSLACGGCNYCSGTCVNSQCV